MQRPTIPFKGALADAFKRVLDYVDALRPAPAPGVLTSHTTRGVVRQPVMRRGVHERPKLVTVITEHPDWLACDDGTDTTLEVAKPEALRTSIETDNRSISGSDPQVVYDHPASAFGDWAGSRTAIITGIGFASTVTQIIWPPYLDFPASGDPEGRGILVARLAEPLALTLWDGTTRTFNWIDLNTDARRWSPVPQVVDASSGASAVTSITVDPVAADLALVIRPGH